MRQPLGHLADDADAPRVELLGRGRAAQVQARRDRDREAGHRQRPQRLEEHQPAGPLASLLHQQQQREPRDGHDEIAPLEDGEPLLREEVAELVDHAVVGMPSRKGDELRDLLVVG